MLHMNNPHQTASAREVTRTRYDIRTRIYHILRGRVLHNRITNHDEASMHRKCNCISMIIEERLFNAARSLDEYSDFQTLHLRVEFLLLEFRRNLAQLRSKNASSSSVGINGGPQQTLIQPNHTTSSSTAINGGGFVANNHQMADVYNAPNMNNVTSSGPQGISLPYANGSMSSQELFIATNMSTLQQPNHLQAEPRYTLRNIDSHVSCIVDTSSGSVAGRSQGSVPYNLTQLSQQRLNDGVHKQPGDIEWQGQHSQMLYPGQLQMDTGLAAPVKQGPTLISYEEARERQATNGITPTQLQYQHSSFEDYYIAAQSAYVPSTQPNPYPHPHQEKLPSILVQGESSQQKRTEYNNDERQHMGVNVYQTTPMESDAAYHFSSATAPISGQTISPTEWKQLWDGNDTSSKDTCLVAPLNQGPSLNVYEEAHERQATNGIIPTKFQYQHSTFEDHHIAAQSAYVPTTQPNSSSHPHQEQLASILVQGKSSQQKTTEYNNDERQHIGVNMYQTTPMHESDAVYRFTSATAPISGQTASPRSSAERKRLRDGNHTSSKDKGLAAPFKQGPSLNLYEDACEVHATDGITPTKLQYQQTDVEDHCIAAQSAYVPSTQPNSSPHHHQKQLASILVQGQSSQQKTTEIPENNNGEREHIGVNICQTTPMQSDAVYHFSSATAPIGGQTISPTTERKLLSDEKDTSSNQVNKDRHREKYVKAQRFLLFMFHVRGCTATEGNCDSNFCFKGKMLVKHVEGCIVPDCKYDLCLFTRKWMSHYNHCKNKSCPVCVYVKKFKQEEKNKRLQLLREAKCSSANHLMQSSMSSKEYGKRRDELIVSIEQRLENAIPETNNISASQPMQSSESRKRYNKRSAEAPSVDDEQEPSIKRMRIERPSENAIAETNSISVTGSGVVCESHSPMDMQEQEKDGFQSVVCESHSPMDMQEQEKDGLQSDDCNSVEVEVNPMDIDASKIEIYSLIELFTPEQVKEHINCLHQCVDQSKTKANKNKEKGCSMPEIFCQLCDVEALFNEQVPLYCSHCHLRIKKKVYCYNVAVGLSRHYICTVCYHKKPEDSLSIDGTRIPKTMFERKKNDEKTEEKWVQCDKCEAWQHQICALFNSKTNLGEATMYTCPNCYLKEVEQGERTPLPSSAVLGAKDLQVTALSNHIEERLFEKLKIEREERATLQEKTYNEVPGAESLTVRVVASVDKVTKVKEGFYELFREENYPSEFPYKSKAVLLFQKIDNVEVCLFAMYVQEFGTESGSSNERCVNVSYLDSVKYFRPEVRTVSGEALRTFVYHEIMISYLDYCKKRGFTRCYIWACPPRRGDDYILYCHPEIQKTPKPDKLREWYLAMIYKALKEDVAAECTNLYDQFFVQSGECKANVTATRIPYFDGDYWTSNAERLIHQMRQEDDKPKKLTSKRALRSSDTLDLSVPASKPQVMMEKLTMIMRRKKEDFIMVHLQHCCKHCSTLMVSGHRWICKQCNNFQICDKCNEVEQNLVDKERHPMNQEQKHELFPVAITDVPTKIEDKDDNLSSECFDTRQAFLNLCQRNSYQYDTLRRAKYSSMMLLYHLHNPTEPKVVSLCVICDEEVEKSQGWYCEVCPAYDVCDTCYSKGSFNHSHNLISRSSSVDIAVPDQNMETTQNDQTMVEKFIETLLHVTKCISKQCQYLRCKEMKKLCRHCIACKISPVHCLHCKKFWSFLRLHSRSCTDTECNVPRCRELKERES